MSSYGLRPLHPVYCTRCQCELVEKRPLTKRQREILDFVATYIGAHGYAPSFTEIAEAFHYRSLATVHEHLAALQYKGWIRRAFNESRAIEVLAA